MTRKPHTHLSMQAKIFAPDIKQRIFERKASHLFDLQREIKIHKQLFGISDKLPIEHALNKEIINIKNQINQ